MRSSRIQKNRRYTDNHPPINTLDMLIGSTENQTPFGGIPVVIRSISYIESFLARRVAQASLFESTGRGNGRPERLRPKLLTAAIGGWRRIGKRSTLVVFSVFSYFISIPNCRTFGQIDRIALEHIALGCRLVFDGSAFLRGILQRARSPEDGCCGTVPGSGRGI